MVALRVPVTAHLLVVAIAVAPRGPVGPAPSCRRRAGIAEPEEAAAAARSALAAWREPRTLLIGVFVLAFAFAEGTGNDWLSVAMIDGYGTSAAVGTLAFAAFLSAMTRDAGSGPACSTATAGCRSSGSCRLAIAGTLSVRLRPGTPRAFAGRCSGASVSRSGFRSA